MGDDGNPKIRRLFQKLFDETTENNGFSGASGGLNQNKTLTFLKPFFDMLDGFILVRPQLKLRRCRLRFDVHSHCGAE
jgi:hypothetical protein